MVALPEDVGLGPTVGLFAGSFFFSTKALAAGLFLRMMAGAGAFGVVEFGPEGGVCPSGVVMIAVSE